MTNSMLVRRGTFATVGLAVILVVTLLLGVGAAYAHHAEVTATVNCNGVVSYTATAWENNSSTRRTNPNIGVWISRDGGPFVQVPHEAGHQFNSANGHQFSDTFQLAFPLPSSVRVRVQAQAPWASGAEPGESRTTGFLTLNCPTPTTTTTTASTTTTTTAASTTTTTTAASTTTTTDEATTTTTSPDATTTTSAPESASTTVAGESVTTSTATPPTQGIEGIQGGPVSPEATGAPGSSAPVGAAAEPGADATLPFTGGSGIGTLALLGLALVGAGAAFVSRRRSGART